jgi:RNA polymerase sigma-70 factor, ECF subfamily
MTRDDERELAELYERTRSRLRAAASRFVGWDDAEDVVQDAFVRALTFPGALRRDASMTNWMTRILFNAAIDETRRRKRQPRTVAMPEFGACEVGANAHHPWQLEVKSALAASSRRDREVLVLAAVLGLSYQETAQRLGLSVATTKSRLHTARWRLQRAISGLPASGRSTRHGSSSHSTRPGAS